MYRDIDSCVIILSRTDSGKTIKILGRNFPNAEPEENDRCLHKIKGILRVKANLRRFPNMLRSRETHFNLSKRTRLI